MDRFAFRQVVRRSACAVAALAVSLVMSAASAAPLTLASDADFFSWSAGNGFVKAFGGNVRWGNAGPSGDWEYSIVNGADSPPGTPMQFDWANVGTPNPHSPVFGWNGSTATLVLGNGAAASQASFGGAPNTLLVRARASDSASNSRDVELRELVVRLLVDNSTIALHDLIGDADAQYVGLVDARLSGGFEVIARSANLAVLAGTGQGSDPAYQFKVGTSNQIPEPGSMALALAALCAAMLARRRQVARVSPR